MNNLGAIMGELWNLVDGKGIATGIKYERGTSTPIPKGLYHLAVEVWFKPSFNELLLTRRHPSKSNGLKWECTCGSALYGESSFEAAQRELSEELGIRVSLSELEYLDTVIEGNCLVDIFLIERSYSYPEIVLQEDEVLAHKYVEIENLELLKDDFREDCWRHFQKYRNKIVGEEYFIKTSFPAGTLVDYFPLYDGNVINLYLTQNGYDRVGLIKYLKNLLGIGIADIQELLSSPPSLLLEDISNNQALMVKKKLNSFGADAEIEVQTEE